MDIDDVRRINANPHTSFDVAPWADREMNCSFCHGRNGGRCVYITNESVPMMCAICLDCAEQIGMAAEDADGR